MGLTPISVRLSRYCMIWAMQLLRGTIRRASFLGAMIDYLIEVDGAHLRTSIETHEAVAKGLMFKEDDSCSISFRDLLWFNAQSLKEVVKQ